MSNKLKPDSNYVMDENYFHLRIALINFLARKFKHYELRGLDVGRKDMLCLMFELPRYYVRDVGDARLHRALKEFVANYHPVSQIECSRVTVRHFDRATTRYFIFLKDLGELSLEEYLAMENNEGMFK